MAEERHETTTSNEDDWPPSGLPTDEEELALCLEILALARRIEVLRKEILGPNSTLRDIRDKLIGKVNFMLCCLCPCCTTLSISYLFQSSWIMPSKQHCMNAMAIF